MGFNSAFEGLTQRQIVVSFRRFETTYRSHLKVKQSRSLTLVTVPAGCPETSITNYISTQKSADLKYLFAFILHENAIFQHLKHFGDECRTYCKRTLVTCVNFVPIYRVADKSLARPGWKQARSMSRTRAISTTSRRDLSSSYFFPARQDAEGNLHHSDRNISFFPSWSG